MKKFLSSVKNMFISWRFALILLVVYAIVLAVATFIEKVQGTSVANGNTIYCNWYSYATLETT